MTTRRLRIALLGMSLSVAAVYVPACEYDSATGQQPGQPAPTPTYTRVVETPSSSTSVPVLPALAV